MRREVMAFTEASRARCVNHDSTVRLGSNVNTARNVPSLDLDGSRWRGNLISLYSARTRIR